MNCPDCGGPMWNNTESKKNPRSPDYKCKSKACGKGVWLRDNEGGGKPPKQMPSGGAPETPGLRGLTPQQQANARQMVRESYAVTMGYVAGFMQKISKESGIPLDMGHVQAATFSIYNTMDKKGIIPSHLKPPVAPPAPKREPEPPRQDERVPREQHLRQTSRLPEERGFPPDDDYPQGGDDLPF